MVQGEGLVVGKTKSGVKVMKKESQGRARKNKTECPQEYKERKEDRVAYPEKKEGD